MMKLHFEDDLDYQKTAIQSVVDLFRGQEISRSEFTVTRREKDDNHYSLGLTENQLGIGNRLQCQWSSKIEPHGRAKLNHLE